LPYIASIQNSRDTAPATNHPGQEGLILRYVFLHSIALASLVGILVALQAYAWSVVAMVVH
jgi:lactate permease